MQEMDLHLELGQLPWPPAHSPQLLDVIVGGHRAVVDAIEARDAARARDLTEEHIETPHPLARSSCGCSADRRRRRPHGSTSGRLRA